jgi:polyferredoxin
MDACDHIMDKTGLEQGLIRLDSENAIADHTKKRVTVKTKAYSVVLVLLMTIIIFLFTLRGNMEATILRTPGMLFQEAEGGYITNLYNVKVINKSNKELNLTFELKGHKGAVEMVGTTILHVDKGESNQQAFFVKIHEDDLSHKKTEIVVGVYEDGILLEEDETNFLGPNK